MKSQAQIAAYLRRFKAINRGGCLVAAYSFYLHEKKYDKHADLQIVCLGYRKDKYITANEAFIKGKGKNATSAMHYGWTFDGGETVFDTDGVHRQFAYKLVIPKDITDAFCISALNNGGWNTWFNRSHIIPKIEKVLGIDLSAVNSGRQDRILGIWAK